MAAEHSDGLECYVSLRIAGSSLDFDSIERALNRTGTKRHRAGEKFALGVRAVDEWSLSTPFPPSESHLDAHIDWLRQVLKSSAPFLKSLASKADVSIYCGFSLFSEISYATLSPSSFSFIADLGVPLQLALFCLPEEPSSAPTDGS
jgi:hypothetical protein